MELKELKAEISEKGVIPLQEIDNRACAILTYRRLCDLKRQPLTALDSQQRGELLFLRPWFPGVSQTKVPQDLEAFEASCSYCTHSTPPTPPPPSLVWSVTFQERQLCTEDANFETVSAKRPQMSKAIEHFLVSDASNTKCQGGVGWVGSGGGCCHPSNDVRTPLELIHPKRTCSRGSGVICSVSDARASVGFCFFVLLDVTLALYRRR